MAHYKNEHGIDCFWPDTTDSELWIEATYASTSLAHLMEQAKDHFGTFEPEQLLISPERIHTSCLYYDAHDPSDWTNFLKLELATTSS